MRFISYLNGQRLRLCGHPGGQHGRVSGLNEEGEEKDGDVDDPKISVGRQIQFNRTNRVGQYLVDKVPESLKVLL